MLTTLKTSNTVGFIDAKAPQDIVKKTKLRILLAFCASIGDRSRPVKVVTYP